MGRPTCSHCYSKHNIMSCEKLKTDYQTSKPIVETWTEEDTQKVERGQFVRWYYRPIDTNDYSKGYRHENADENGDVADSYHSKQCERHGLPVTITQPTYIEYEAFYSGNRYSISRHRSIVEKYEKIVASKARRAAKSCSWCKGAGHTVRTCQQRKDDAKTWEKVVLLDSYYKAKAISEFGLWTAAMLAVSGDEELVSGNAKGCYMLTSRDTSRWKRKVHFPSDLDNEEVDVQTQFLGSLTEHSAFIHTKDLGNSDRYGADSLGTYDVGFNVLEKEWYLLRTADTSTAAVTFLPAKVNFEEIFSIFASRVSELPKNGFDKHTQAHRLSIGTHWRSSTKHASSSSCDMIEGVGVKKKERNTYSFEKMEAWVKSQEETLNKIYAELV